MAEERLDDFAAGFEDDRLEDFAAGFEDDRWAQAAAPEAGNTTIRLHEARYPVRIQVHLAAPEQSGRYVLTEQSVAGTETPGTIKRSDREAILRHAPGIRLSPHDPALKETLLMLELTDQGPSEVHLVGVVPGNTNMGVGLTDPVRQSIEPAARAVLDELARMGVEPIAREGANEAHLWWDA